jgi:hypothetical protein
MRGSNAPLRLTIEDPPDRRVRQVHVPSLPADVIRIKLRHGPVDPHLRGVDRCLQRWVATPGMAMSAPQLSQVRFVYGQNARPSALGDRECEMVDRAILSSPAWVTQLVQLWYRTDRPAHEIAQILGSQRRQTTYERLNLALAYLLGRLVQMGLRGVIFDEIG